jgi:hypothetical protein
VAIIVTPGNTAATLAAKAATTTIPVDPPPPSRSAAKPTFTAPICLSWRLMLNPAETRCATLKAAVAFPSDQYLAKTGDLPQSANRTGGVVWVLSPSCTDKPLQNWAIRNQ